MDCRLLGRGNSGPLLPRLAEIPRRQRRRHRRGSLPCPRSLQVALVLVIFAIVVAIWRYISLGSIVATAAFPLLVYFMKHPPLPIVLGAAGSALIIIAMHHANIRRLLNGTENKVGKKKSEVSGQ